MGAMCLSSVEQLSSSVPMYANSNLQALLAIYVLLAAVLVTQIRMSSLCVCVLTRPDPSKAPYPFATLPSHLLDLLRLPHTPIPWSLN